jgi:uncharacterized protein
VRCSEENRLHTLLKLTEKPGQWPIWLVASILLALAASAGWAWARATAQPFWGGAILGVLLLLALADWILLASLPRWGRSFGAAQPPLLAWALLRTTLAWLAAPLAARWPWPVTAILAVIQVLLWILLTYGTLVEPFRVQVTHLTIPNPKLSNPAPPLRIVQLSDVHIERLTPRDRSLPALVAELKPDLIVLTGDFLNTSYNDDPQAVAELIALLEQLHAPAGIYGVWGTQHVDLPDILRPALEGLGIVILNDQALEIEVAGRRLWLMGVYPTRDLPADAARLAELLAAAPPGVATVLLHHTPDLMPQAAALGVDLYLAGHTHGGQWRLPGFGALVTSSHYWKRYEAGYYSEDNTHLYVSRGLGLEGFGAPRARFFCPPEVVTVDFGGPGAPTVDERPARPSRGR